jgi:hypothetical protein
MVWEGHVVRIGTGEGRTGFWCGDLMERNHFEDLRTDGKIILKYFFKNCYGDMDWIGLV